MSDVPSLPTLKFVPAPLAACGVSSTINIVVHVCARQFKEGRWGATKLRPAAGAPVHYEGNCRHRWSAVSREGQFARVRQGVWSRLQWRFVRVVQRSPVFVTLPLVHCRAAIVVTSSKTELVLESLRILSFKTLSYLSHLTVCCSNSLRTKFDPLYFNIPFFHSVLWHCFGLSSL